MVGAVVGVLRGSLPPEWITNALQSPRTDGMAPTAPAFPLYQAGASFVPYIRNWQRAHKQAAKPFRTPTTEGEPPPSGSAGSTMAAIASSSTSALGAASATSSHTVSLGPANAVLEDPGKPPERGELVESLQRQLHAHIIQVYSEGAFERWLEEQNTIRWGIGGQGDGASHTMGQHASQEDVGAQGAGDALPCPQINGAPQEEDFPSSSSSAVDSDDQSDDQGDDQSETVLDAHIASVDECK